MTVGFHVDNIDHGVNLSLLERMVRLASEAFGKSLGMGCGVIVSAQVSFVDDGKLVVFEHLPNIIEPSESKPSSY